MGLRRNVSIQLDFSLETVEERTQFIEELLIKLRYGNYTPTESELELFSNYILYGKDADGTSIVDRKEVQISTHYAYKRAEDQSLEALMEAPGFNETKAFNRTPIQYRKPKVKFDRAAAQGIPELEPIFEEIDELDKLLAAWEGTLDQTEENEPYYARASTLTSQQVYHMRHMLVELRREQYTIKDFYKPVLQQLIPLATYRGGEEDASIPWQEGIYEIAPLGLYCAGLQRFEDPRAATDNFCYNEKAKFILDFRNPEHLYMLFEMRLELETASADDPESTLTPLLDTLDFYTTRAPLSKKQRDILYYKIHKVPNYDIARVVNNQYNCSHSFQYISTIYKHEICDTIANFVKYHYDEYLHRNEPYYWKKCITCGQTKLKDARNFVRKSRSSDGLANRCKECDKIYRMLAKRGEEI